MMRSAHRVLPVLVAGCTTMLLLLTPSILAGDEPSFDRAMSLFRAGKYDPAADGFLALLDDSPGWADGWFMVGLCRMKTGRDYEAAGYFRMAMERGEGKYRYAYNLALAYIKLERYDDAREALDEAERLAPAERLRQLDKLRDWLDHRPVRRPTDMETGLYDLPPRYWRHYPVEPRK